MRDARQAAHVVSVVRSARGLQPLREPEEISFCLFLHLLVPLPLQALSPNQRCLRALLRNRPRHADLRAQLAVRRLLIAQHSPQLGAGGATPRVELRVQRGGHALSLVDHRAHHCGHVGAHVLSAAAHGCPLLFHLVQRRCGEGGCPRSCVRSQLAQTATQRVRRVLRRSAETEIHPPHCLLRPLIDACLRRTMVLSHQARALVGPLGLASELLRRLTLRNGRQRFRMEVHTTL
mmetsp:Transcript_42612/g.103451  ORF Transcript_42612/g.103451 Transcript_42612/m.103451 type:complete len:234 (-) Transcript_42612:386-1087(-)